MIKQRILRLLIFSFVVGAVLLWAQRLAGHETQLKVVMPQPVEQAMEKVKGVTTSVAKNEQVQGIKSKFFTRFQKEKEKIVEDKVKGIVEEIKSLPETQLEEFKSELCSEVCSE